MAGTNQKPKPERKAMAAAGAVQRGEMTQSDAARHYGVTRQAVHRALERLKKRSKIAGVSAGQVIVDDPMGRP